MGVLARRRSFLLKLVVVLGTAWFTIAFLLYSEDQNNDIRIVDSGGGGVDLGVNPQAERFVQPDGPVPENPFENNLLEEVVEQQQQPETKDKKPPFKPKGWPEVKQVGGVLPVPDVADAGEMGKPVILPTNLSGKF